MYTCHYNNIFIIFYLLKLSRIGFFFIVYNPSLLLLYNALYFMAIICWYVMDIDGPFVSFYHFMLICIWDDPYYIIFIVYNKWHCYLWPIVKINYEIKLLDILADFCKRQHIFLKLGTHHSWQKANGTLDQNM